MSTALFWFRQDLRCQDNPGLNLACKNHRYLIPIYIHEQKPALKMGGAQQWWLHHSLDALSQKLQQAGLHLNLRKGNPEVLLKELISKHKIEAVYWNRCYEPMHIKRDKHIKAELKKLGLNVMSSNGNLLNEPWDVTNKSGGYFKVFTPYWRHCLREMRVDTLKKISTWPLNKPIDSDKLNDWGLLPTHPNWAKEFSNHWKPGEEGALDKLEQFIQNNLNDYKEKRNLLATSGTSKLSPHLHFGEISPQQIWCAIQEAMKDPRCNLVSAQNFISELGWREFSYQLLYHFPHIMEANFKEQFDSFPWQNDEKLLHSWQKGLTGYPVVDAGMRELWRTGYMHNRVRMIVASSLTKDLMIDWKKGAAWFWDTLLDADLANNSASWQWVAGSGADAAPYYRVFNPTLQGEKFDPEGEYIKRWVPELLSVSKKWIHEPWKASTKELPITLGKDYPLPIVDHALAREFAPNCYQKMK